MFNSYYFKYIALLKINGEDFLAFDLAYITAVIISVVITVIINSLFVWVAGRLLVGGQKARFTDALWIVILNAVVIYVVGIFVSGLIGAIITFVLYLLLIKHFFDCGWIKALIIDIIAVILQIVVAFIIALILGVTITTFGV